MIYYISTRGDKKKYTFSEAILDTLDQDGGLFIPEEIPHIELQQIQDLLNKSYSERLRFTLETFQTDLLQEDKQIICNTAYHTSFDTSHVTPLVHLKDDQFIVELWHGPTAAFKDIALQLMPLFMIGARKIYDKKYFHQENKYLNRLILVSTTGDTGKAAMEGFKDKNGFGVIVFFQEQFVSQLQQLLMVTQEGNNVDLFMTEENVDEVELAIKSVYTDEEFTQNLLTHHEVSLESANSIDWARFIPQIAYYLNSYLEMVQQSEISFGQQVDIVVPTGSFGNILSAFYAQAMGVPIRKLICATNENNVVAEFLQTGVYDISEKVILSTPSNSMDTLIAGNIERLLFIITRDGEKVSSWMQNLLKNRRFEVDNETKLFLQDHFFADWVSSIECLINIKDIYDQTQYLMDPHTSVAQLVAERYQNQQQSQVPIVIASTAHWTKFPKSVHMALTGSKNSMSDLEAIENVQKIIHSTFVPQNIKLLKDKKIRFTQHTNITKQKIEEIITKYCNAHWKRLV